jgi:hypothetical protein
MITDSIVSSCGGWDEAGEYGDVQLYQAVLAIDTKKFKKGQTVETISFVFSKSLCQIWDKAGCESADGCQPMEVIEEFALVLTPVFNL